jgi:hypothetical protein
MNQTPLESYEARRQSLARLMSRCSEVSRYDTDTEKEAWTLAHALLDLEQSFSRFTRELLPKLEREDLSSDDVCDVLHTMGEEFRHILYHIGDPKYFRYLPAWGGAQRDLE